MTKKNEIKYGIEIAKPHSTAMYDHNDLVAESMKRNITSAWADEMIKFSKTDEWPSAAARDSKMNDIQSSICATGFGDGFTIDEVHTDFMSNLSDMANWQLHEEYSYLQFKGHVPRTHFMMIGFNTQEWPAGTPINYDYTNANELSPFAPSVQVK